jgi:hypothetical protein
MYPVGEVGGRIPMAMDWHEGCILDRPSKRRRFSKNNISLYSKTNLTRPTITKRSNNYQENINLNL